MPEEKDPKDVQGDGKPPEGIRTFTQDELNTIVSDRLRREHEKYADYEDLKAAKARLNEIDQERLTELEKVQKRADDAEKERDVARQRAQDTAIRAALAMEAAKAGALHPEDAFQLADLSSVTIGDNGDVQGATEAVAALIAGKRLVLKGRGAADLDAGAGGGERTGERKPTLTADELEAAGKMGLTAEEYQKGKR
ncbi:MAG TPA: hypothetical protein VMX14_12655 [Anaerolineae bacterium]|nr:hypothetical protein [Anaerolineae bacterium]